MQRAEGNRKLPTVQVLRGIAASLVVFHHYARIYQDGSRPSRIYNSGLGNLGMCGVDIFFVISGFIMVYTSGRKAGMPQALTFLAKRALRIYPLYWIWTSLLLVLWIAGIMERQHHYSHIYLLCSYLLVPVFNGQYFHPLLDQGWTLSFEMYFYIVFAAAISLKLQSRRLLFLIVAFVALSLLGRILPDGNGVRYLLTSPLIAEFLFGVLAAEIASRLPASREGRLAKVIPPALIAIGAIALLCTIKLNDPSSIRFVVYGIPALMIVMGAVMFRQKPAPKVLVYLGDCSYSIYLTHLFFAMEYASALKHHPAIARLSPDASIVVFGTITIILCSFTYRLVERPLTRALSFQASR